MVQYIIFNTPPLHTHLRLPSLLSPDTKHGHGVFCVSLCESSMAHCAGSHLSHDSGLVRSLLFCALRQLALLLLSEVDLIIAQNSLLHKAALLHSGMEMALLCYASSSHRWAVLFSVLGMISVETVGLMCDYTKL